MAWSLDPWMLDYKEEFEAIVFQEKVPELVYIICGQF